MFRRLPAVAIPGTIKEPATATAHRTAKRGLLTQMWEERWAYLFVAPPVIGYLVFFAYPVLLAFVASFAKFDMFTMKPLDNPFYNYQRVFRDPMVLRAYRNVTQLFVMGWFGSQTISLGLALALNAVKRFVGLLRTLFYIPIVTSIVVVSAIFRWLFMGDAAGPMNQILKASTGLGPVRWLQDGALAIPTISLIGIWLGIGFSIIIWTAGMKDIPTAYYEAAVIDGANSWAQFWHITLPLLRPVIVYQAVMGLIGGMKEFGLVFTMSQGGAAPSITITPVLMLYRYAFQQLQMGYACALAYVLTAVILVLTILQFKILGMPEAYD